MRTEQLRFACAAIAEGEQVRAAKQSGIYVIVHIESLRQYTGTTMNFSRRMSYHRTHSLFRHVGMIARLRPSGSRSRKS